MACSVVLERPKIYGHHRSRPRSARFSAPEAKVAERIPQQSIAYQGRKSSAGRIVERRDGSKSPEVHELSHTVLQEPIWPGVIRVAPRKSAKHHFRRWRV